jgi:hypothetical protein
MISRTYAESTANQSGLLTRREGHYRIPRKLSSDQTDGKVVGVITISFIVLLYRSFDTTSNEFQVPALPPLVGENRESPNPNQSRCLDWIG